MCLTSRHITTESSGLFIAATKSRAVLKVWWAWRLYEVSVSGLFPTHASSAWRELKTDSSQKSLQTNRLHSSVTVIKWTAIRKVPVLPHTGKECFVYHLHGNAGHLKARFEQDWGKYWNETGLAVTVAILVSRAWRPTWLWGVEALTFSIQSAHRWRWSWEPYAIAALYLQGWFLVLNTLTGWVDPRTIVRLEGLELKNPITSSGIETAAFLLRGKVVAWNTMLLSYSFRSTLYNLCD
jgi:hypothetical protein